MFWKVFAVLCLISASYFAYSHLKLAKVPSVIPATAFVERSIGGKWYRTCGRDSGYRQIECDEWAKPHSNTRRKRSGEN